MYAIIKCGPKQYRVKEGQLVKLEKIDLEPGANVEFSALVTVDEQGELKLQDPSNNKMVTGVVESHGRHKKINVVHFRRRKHSRTQMGHRQWYTEVKIVKIASS